MIYLASPYTHANPAIREARYHAAMLYTAQRLSAGIAIFSPIVYGHHIALTHGCATDAHTWEKFNTEMLRRASQMVVLELDGWKASIGVALEITLARKLFIPITHVKPSEDY